MKKSARTSRRPAAWTATKEAKKKKHANVSGIIESKNIESKKPGAKYLPPGFFCGINTNHTEPQA